MKDLLNLTMLFLLDAVCYLGICVYVSAVIQPSEFALPVSASLDSNWPLMHASAAKFMSLAELTK